GIPVGRRRDRGRLQPSSRVSGVRQQSPGGAEGGGKGKGKWLKLFSQMPAYQKIRMGGSPRTYEEQLTWFGDFVQRTRRQREVWDTVPASSVALVSGLAFCLLASISAISQLASAHVSIAR